MNKKHQCLDCNLGGTIAAEPWWAIGKLYQVQAVHIHTGTAQIMFATDDAERARRYIDRMKESCTSHDGFALLN